MKHPKLSVANRTIVDSCRVARGVQQDLERVRSITKDDRSPVTVADFAVQAIVAMALFEEDPAARIVGEEHSDVLRQPDQAAVRDAVVRSVRTVRPDRTTDDVLHAIDRCDHDATGSSYWALDPVDGTKGFLRGQQYAIALGFIENGQVTLGVLGCPNLPVDHAAPLDQADGVGTIYAAARGEGAWELSPEGGELEVGSGRRIEVAPFAEDGPIRICESVEKGHSKQSDTERIVDALSSATLPVRLDSQCKYAVVARGQADAYLRLPTKKAYVEKIWDHAAGSLVATEAGAVVSDISGSPLNFTLGPRLEANRGVVCTTAALHERVIAVIEELGIGAAV